MTFLKVGSSRIWVVALVVASVALAGALGWRQLETGRKTYRVGYSVHPELFRPNAAGGPDGFAVAIMEAAAKRADVRIEWVLVPESGETALLEERVDIWPFLHQKEYLKSRVHFSRPYLDTEFSLLRLQTAKEQPGPRSKVALPTGAFNNYIGARLFPEAQRLPVSGGREMLERLCKGDVAYGLIQRRLAISFAEEWGASCASPLPLIHRISSPELEISFASVPAAAGATDAIRNALDDVLAERPIQTFTGSFYVDVGVTENFARTLKGVRDRNHVLSIGLSLAALALAVGGGFTLRFRDSNRKLRDVLSDRERLLAELQRAEATKVQFVANVSHELCTPMIGIQGAVDLLKDAPLTKQQQQLVKLAGESSRSLMALIRQLLDFSQLEANQLEFGDRPFSVQEVIETMARPSCVAAEAKGLTFLLSIDPSAPVWLRGDPQRVRRVVECLAGNAVKFTAAGRIRLCVLAPPDGCGDAAQIEIADTGTGIAPELQARIFEAFEQADTSMTRQYGGLGLGLAMALRLARRMGGHIALNSVPGSGSKFTFRLPAAMLCPVPAGQSPFRPVRQGKKKKRAVIVHSDPEVREALRVTVSASGLGVIALPELPHGGLVGDSISYVFVEETQLERRWPSWPPRTRVVLLYQRGVTSRANIPGRGIAEIASPFLPSEVRHLLTGGSFALGATSLFPTPVEQAGEGLGLRVLLVDDSRTNLKIAEQILHRMGCAVTAVENGQLAIDTLEFSCRMGKPMDVVLMDCQMPVLDGYEATRRIRKSCKPYRTVPIIALTAQIGDGEREHCLDSGMSDYATKPISRQAIWKLLQRHGTSQKPTPDVDKSDTCVDLVQKESVLGHPTLLGQITTAIH